MRVLELGVCQSVTDGLVMSKSNLWFRERDALEVSIGAGSFISSRDLLEI